MATQISNGSCVVSSWKRSAEKQADDGRRKPFGHLRHRMVFADIGVGKYVEATCHVDEVATSRQAHEVLARNALLPKVSGSQNAFVVSEGAGPHRKRRGFPEEPGRALLRFIGI